MKPPCSEAKLARWIVAPSAIGSLNGTAVEPTSSYRVTVNNYLSTGGDGFTALTEGTSPQFGVYDADALYAYFQANGPISPVPADRIKRSSEAK